jgi:hypothetical protein
MSHVTREAFGQGLANQSSRLRAALPEAKITPDEDGLLELAISSHFVIYHHGTNFKTLCIQVMQGGLFLGESKRFKSQMEMSHDPSNKQRQPNSMK